ncbi:hypothetical protein WA158_006334 [Blastocystis sp. Blastoise]
MNPLIRCTFLKGNLISKLRYIEKPSIILLQNLRFNVAKTSLCTSSVSNIRFFATNTQKDINNKDNNNRIWTIPNLMSFTRLASCPLLYYCITGTYMSYALPIFAFSSLLDFTDGWVARKFNQRSYLGTIIDPLADKCLMFTMAIALGIQHIIHPAVASIIIDILYYYYCVYYCFIIDVAMVLGFLYLKYKASPKTFFNFHDMSKKVEVKPNMLGKTNTVLQMLLFISCLCTPYLSLPALYIPICEGIVSATTLTTLANYAIHTDKAVVFHFDDKKDSMETLNDIKIDTKEKNLTDITENTQVKDSKGDMNDKQ